MRPYPEAESAEVRDSIIGRGRTSPTPFYCILGIAERHRLREKL